VDGKVERNADGKEVRFPVILSYREKEIARRIGTYQEKKVKNTTKTMMMCALNQRIILILVMVF
jgi:hypothetical protein